MTVDNSLNNYAIVFYWHKSISRTILLLLLCCCYESVSCLLLILLLLVWCVVVTVMQLATGHHTAVAGRRPGWPETTIHPLATGITHPVLMTVS